MSERYSESIEEGSARWASTFPSAGSPTGSQGSPVVNPAVRPGSHRIGVRHGSRPPGSCHRSGGTGTSAIPISSP